MGTILDYLSWRGDLSFRQDPFNEVDNLILSLFLYVNLDQAAPRQGEGELTVEAVAKKFFSIHTKEELERDRSFIRRAPEVLAAMAETERFRHAIVRNYVNDVKRDPDMQFAAAEILLEDGSTNVFFRGTDDTIAGWREDFDLSLGVVPSDRAAAGYLTMVGRNSTGPIRVGGHSKGGHLAVYAAGSCEENVQQRIKCVYSNDGPGFLQEFLDSPGYRRIEERIERYIPEASVIGQLLQQTVAPRVVVSDARGLMEHDGLCWQVMGPRFVPGEINETADQLNQTLHQWLDQLKEEERDAFIRDIFSVLDASGAETLTQLQEGGLKGAAAMLSDLTKILPGTRSELEVLLRAVLPFWKFFISGK